MEGTINDELHHDPTGDHPADGAEHRVARSGLDSHDATHVDAIPPAPFEIRRVDRPGGADHRPDGDVPSAGHFPSGVDHPTDGNHPAGRDHRSSVVLTLAGELDLTTAPRLQEQLDRAMRDARVVVIDLSGLLFIDSSGLHTLVHAEQQLSASGGQLMLVHGSPTVSRVFQLTGLSDYFTWRDSQSALPAPPEPSGDSVRIPSPLPIEKPRPSLAAD